MLWRPRSSCTAAARPWAFPIAWMLQIARKAGHLPLGTFDRVLARVDGAQKL